MALVRSDDVERAHLRDPSDRSFTMARFGPQLGLEPLVRRYWMPVWTVPDGQERRQQVLQYPVSLIVVSEGYARFYGVTTGLSETVLTGSGWACGVMLQAATGHLLTGESMRRYTDRFVDVADVIADGEALAQRIREVMAPDPADPGRQQVAADVVADTLTPLLPLSRDAVLVNEVVAFVEETPDLREVAELARRFDLAERALQRMTSHWLGLRPKWLIQRRRLHEVAERLRQEDVDLAAVAADLGYADQAHFTRDWRRVTGMTPGRSAARLRHGTG